MLERRELKGGRGGAGRWAPLMAVGGRAGLRRRGRGRGRLRRLQAVVDVVVVAVRRRQIEGG